MLDSSTSKMTGLRYQVCVRCVMDTTDPEISFDSEGICNHCRSYDRYSSPKIERANSPEGERILQTLVDDIKAQGRGKDYDCVIGISGGVDSTYVAWMVAKLGLRPLAVHFDSGWNSELAVNNIENILRKLKIDLHTVVCDWEEMRDLQLSYFKSSLANCDVPTDHAIYATVNRIAAKYGIKTIVSGGNLATESILPTSWGHNHSDLTQLYAVQKQFGTLKLKHYPTCGFFGRYVWYRYILRIREVRLLDYLPYSKKEAKRIITEELGWRDYGGKHYESIFTRFFQSYYLPHKFGFDKRRAHLSSLIVTGEMTRDQALAELQQPPDVEDRQRDDKEFVAKKLGITLQQFDEIINLPAKTFRDYPSGDWLFRLKDRLKATFVRSVGEDHAV
jgi:N-acetyl sugar amidotransferase